MMLAAGCSIAHGQGTVIEKYDLENCKWSYPNLIAEKLEIMCNNISYPSNSNEEIFHSVVDELEKNVYTHCLVSWSSLAREVWKTTSGRWTFNLNHATYHDYVTDGRLYIDRSNNNKIVSTDQSKISILQECLKTFEIKILNDAIEDKIRNYKSVIMAICNNKGIEVLQVDAIKNDNASNLYLLDTKLFKNPQGPELHPPRESHEFWANDIYNKFYAK